MTRAMKRVVVETVVPENFKYIARDQDGSVHVFEKKPNLDYGTNANPTACDMWDVYEGETMQVSPKTPVIASPVIKTKFNPFFKLTGAKKLALKHKLISVKFFLIYINKFSMNAFVIYRIIIALILFSLIY